MRKNLLVVFLLLVITPIVTISWLGLSGFRRERVNAYERYRISARKELEDIDRQIRSFLTGIETDLQGFSRAHTLDFDELRRLTRTADLVGQLIIVDDEGHYRFPPEDGEMSERERGFVEEAKEREIASVLGGGNREAVRDGGAGGFGWYTWFSGDGVNFIYWQRPEAGVRIGVLVDRIVLIAKAIAFLPETDFSVGSDDAGRIMIVDARGGILYQWGSLEPSDDDTPLSEMVLSAPLGAWSLRYYRDPGGFGTTFGIGDYTLIIPGIAALVVALLLLAVYYFRENAKVVTDALQKVSFVNQVSHELRTPLTNIRLYAELLEAGLLGETERSRLKVIMSESRRLSRMIANVLAFAQLGKTGFEANPVEVVIDDVVNRVFESFSPALESKSFRVVLSLNASITVRTDIDFVEQILSNLIGNAEKYASDGGYIEISTEARDSHTVIAVKDRGPGIPVGERRRIFQPFYRISNKLSDGVSGAGIGLAISQKLAEALGGRITVADAKPGALFTVTIKGSAVENINENTDSRG